MARYEHRQPGTLTLAALLLGLAVVAALFFLADIALSRQLYRLHIRNRPY